MVETRILPTRSMTAHEAPVRLIAFGPNGLMFTADVDMQCVVWRDDEPILRLNKRSALPRLRPHDRVRAAVFSQSGDVLYIACGSRLLAIDTSNGDEVWSHRATEWWPFMISIPEALAVDDEGCLVVAFANGTLERWTPDFKRVYRIRDHDAPIFFTLDRAAGKIVGCDAYHICVWNVTDGAKQSRFKLDDHAYAFAYSPATGLAAVRDADKVAVWNLLGTEGGERLSVPPGPPLLAFNPKGTVLAYECGSEVRLHPIDGSGQKSVWFEDSRNVSLAFDRDGRLWTGQADGSVHCWAE